MASIKGDNLVTNSQKLTSHNPKIDLVVIKANKRFCQILSISFQDIERKRKSDINQGP